MTQHVDDVEPCRGRAAGEGHIATASHEYAQIGKFRDIFGDRLAERDLPLLHQLHEGDRSDRFGHAGDAENGIMVDT